MPCLRVLKMSLNAVQANLPSPHSFLLTTPHSVLGYFNPFLQDQYVV